MALTRAKVRAELGELQGRAAEYSLPTKGPLGKDLTEEVVDTAYRDVRRCIFCGKRSVEMSFGMLNVDAHLARIAGFTEGPHLRFLLFGLCPAHSRLVSQDPGAWTDKLQRQVDSKLRERIGDTARLN
jgi:hypothetical protein